MLSLYPGNNAQGLADLLIQPNSSATPDLSVNQFSASLPFTWPIGPCDINNNIGTANSLTAFDYGFAFNQDNSPSWVNLPRVNDCPKTISEWLQ